VKHFLSRELLAPNVWTFPVARDIVERFSDPAALPGKYSTVRPSQWLSDIKWISAADEEAFDVFESAFDDLEIAARGEAYLDLDRKVRLYAGFLVVRSRCSEPEFHVDWLNANNEAFTCLTPVSANGGPFGLLYKRLTGEVGEYEYSLGEAIAFGDNFVHSTKPGRSDEPVVLLSFVYGTDKMEHWPKIYPTVGRQVTHVRQPDGRFVRADANPSE